MDAEEFIDTIKQVVRDAAIRDLLSIVEHPPGKKPSQRLTEMAEWYSSLDNRSRKLVASLVAEAIDTAIFGFLCVVDGVRAAENTPAKGRFELLHIGERVTLLNAPEGIMLHDLYSAQ